MSYKLLDLFCKAGGCSWGYHLAGFKVTGVDIAPQPRYPFAAFHQANALDFPLDGFDVIHASPPCQAYSKASQYRRNEGVSYADLIPAIRQRLVNSGKPYIIENVVGAPLLNPIMLCGSSFGLSNGEIELRRHRIFESNIPLLSIACRHSGKQSYSPCGNGTQSYHREKLGRNVNVREIRDLMQCEWMSRAELSQAIPPAYTRYIGLQLIAKLTEGLQTSHNSRLTKRPKLKEESEL